ncbi:MAG: hypothetical protein GX158_00385 [Bacteroidales bacterium]|nr:hypothetical protein [Bacteroidales bacterium]
MTIVKGDHSVSEYLLSYKFDYIFFTGSSEIGSYVMQIASPFLPYGGVGYSGSGRSYCLYG